MSFCCSAVYSCEELKPVVKSVLGNTLNSRSHGFLLK